MKKYLVLTLICCAIGTFTAKAQCDPDVAEHVTFKWEHDKKTDVVSADKKVSTVFLTVTNTGKRNLVASFDIKAGDKVVGHFENKTPIVAGSSKKLGGKVTVAKSEHVSDVDITILNKDCTSKGGKGTFHIGSLKAHITAEQLKELGLI